MYPIGPLHVCKYTYMTLFDFSSVGFVTSLFKAMVYNCGDLEIDLVSQQCSSKQPKHQIRSYLAMQKW